MKNNYVYAKQRVFRRDQVKLLVYGPKRPYSNQKQKNNITKLVNCFFLKIYCFLLFYKNKK